MIRFLPAVVLLLIGSVFTTIGGGVYLLLGKPILESAQASTSWPTTEGTILESELEKTRDEDNGTMYSALVVYQFAVDGAELESDKVWYGGGTYSTSDRTEMKRVVDKYPVGKAVTVYYNPEDPYEAVLEPGAFAGSYIGYIIGLVFLGLGGALLLGGVIAALMAIRKPQNPAVSSEDNQRDEFEYRNPLGDRL